MPQPYQQILEAFGYPTGDSAVDDEIVKQARLRAGMSPQLGDPDSWDNAGEQNASDAEWEHSPGAALPGPAEVSPRQAGDEGDLSLYNRWKEQAMKNPPRLVFPKR